MSGAMSGSKMLAWRRVLHIPPNGPAGGKNAYQRSIIWTIRPINGSFVGRMQYAPTRGHVNTMRFSYSTTMKQSNAPHFLPPTP